IAHAKESDFPEPLEPVQEGDRLKSVIRVLPGGCEKMISPFKSLKEGYHDRKVITSTRHRLDRLDRALVVTQLCQQPHQSKAAYHRQSCQICQRMAIWFSGRFRKAKLVLTRRWRDFV